MRTILAPLRPTIGHTESGSVGDQSFAPCRKELIARPVAGGMGPPPGPRTSMPLIRALSVTVVKTRLIWPLALAVAVNCSITALFIAPAVAKMSKLVSTCVPLLDTLKMRWPAAVQNVSAKCRRTVWLDPAGQAGIG